MLSTASGYLNAANLIDRKFGEFGQSSVLLKTIGFEILLKAVFRYEHGNIKFSHEYDKIFFELSEETQKYLLEEGSARNFSSEFLDINDREILRCILKAFTNNFQKGRYDYEVAEKYSVLQQAKRGKTWVDNGCPSEDSDFNYYPEEMRALCFGLKRWLTTKLEE